MINTIKRLLSYLFVTPIYIGSGTTVPETVTVPEVKENYRPHRLTFKYRLIEGYENFEITNTVYINTSTKAYFVLTNSRTGDEILVDAETFRNLFILTGESNV